MKTIFADFNAISEAGDFWLGCRGSERDLLEAGARVGDWVWLSDGELVVGAKIRLDEVEGLVGMPRWRTLVHLDDDDTQMVPDVLMQVLQLPSLAGHDLEVEARRFQLLTILEVITPQAVKDALPLEYFALRRAAALLSLEEPGVALLVLRDALETWPDDPNLGLLYLETLRRFDLDRADAEAGRRAEADGAIAPVLAACINIRSTIADRASDEEFAAIGTQILEWVARFERAPGRDRAGGATLASVRFNEGLALLRLGRLGGAREAFERAHAANPDESAIVEASRLEVYDDQARQIASRLHEMPPMVAA